MYVIILASAALAGIAVGRVWHVEPGPLLMVCAVATLGACLAWRQSRWRMLALVACTTALGAVRPSLAPTVVQAQPTDLLKPYLGGRVRLRAQVSELPRLVGGGAYTRLVLAINGIGPPGQEPSALGSAAHAPPPVVVLADPASSVGSLGQGERVTLEGRLVAAADARGPPLVVGAQLVDAQAAQPVGPGRDRLAADEPGAVSQPPASALVEWMRRLGSVRLAASANVRRYLPEPQASLAIGVLLGGTGRLSPDFKLDLQRSGLTHVLAIDGYKQVLVAGLVGALVLRLFGVRGAILTTVALITGYTLLTGAHPSAVRAALMLGLASVATLTGRVPDPLTSLSLVVLALASIEPSILLDVGLQLSVSATLGIILLWPRLRRRLRRLPRWIAEPLGLSAAVTLATLPVTLSAFQLVSLISPLAHVVAVPLLPLVLLSTTLLAILAAAPPPSDFATFVAALPAPLVADLPWLAHFLAVVTWLAGLSAAVTTHLPWLTCLAAFATWLASLPPVFAITSPLRELAMRAAEPLSVLVPWVASLFSAALESMLTNQLPSPVLLAAWLAWLPTTLLAWVIHAFGSMPAAGVSTGRLPPPAAVALAAGLLAYGVWQLPEFTKLRIGLRRWQSNHPMLLAPLACTAACLGAAMLLRVLQPDGQLHVEPLELSRGQAVFIRGPTGTTALVVSGQPSPTSLTSQVAQNLAVWEHQLNLVVALDGTAQKALVPMLTRYPADKFIRQQNSQTPQRVDIGRGAAIDVWSAGGQLRVAIDETTSVPTTSAARPGSAD